VALDTIAKELGEDDGGSASGDEVNHASAESMAASDAPAYMAGVTNEGDASNGFDITREIDEGSPPGIEREPGGVHVAERRRTAAPVELGDGTQVELDHGAVVIAAITSCTNTSNPAVMLAAGLLARNAVERGLSRKPWVKTSLAPGSKVVMDYYERAGLIEPLETLGFSLVGYGCTTCIGNSGPLPTEISEAIEANDLTVASVLSGNRNFEGRVHPEVKMNYLASPPLVVAYALAGRMDVDLVEDPLGEDSDGQPVYLRDLWPSQREIHDTIESAVQSDMFRASYAEVFEGGPEWSELDVPEGDRYAWDPDSTYVKRPPYFDDMPADPPEGFEQVTDARILAVLGDSVTTDHISPAGAIKRDSPAGRYLMEHGIEHRDFNSYGSRRGNHEVMMRGTFANVRLRNQLAPGTEGGVTVKLPEGEQTSIFEASMSYQAEGVPLGVLAGKEYGSGSSRDWAAKGPRLLGVRFVIAETYERIHRSNLVGMGVLPLQFPEGESRDSLGLTGKETFDLAPLEDGARTLGVTARPDDGDPIEFEATVRIDTPNEWLYYRHGGILHYVLRQLLKR
jgi:aconitate hydratase